jgi:hypothetical protein
MARKNRGRNNNIQVGKERRKEDEKSEKRKEKDERHRQKARNDKKKQKVQRPK